MYGDPELRKYLPDWAQYLPEVSVRRGGLTHPRFILKANSLPVALKNSHGLMLRLTTLHGYEGNLTGDHTDVHDQDGLLTVRVKGVLRGSGVSYAVELLHLESRHDATGTLATIMQVSPALRQTVKGRTRSGIATFRLELFRPNTV